MHAFDERLRSRAEITALATNLVSEYSGRVPAGAVLACVTRVHEELRRAGATSGIPGAVEAMTRNRLDQQIPPHTGILSG